MRVEPELMILTPFVLLKFLIKNLEVLLPLKIILPKNCCFIMPFRWALKFWFRKKVKMFAISSFTVQAVKCCENISGHVQKTKIKDPLPGR